MIKAKFRGGRFRAPKLDGGQLTMIGEEMVARQKARILSGINADGGRTAPLAPSYAKRKIRQIRKLHGKTVMRPIRDMFLTGETMKNFRLRTAINGRIVARATTTWARMRVRSTERRGDQMIGFSQAEVNALVRDIRMQYGLKLQRAFVRVG